MDVLRADRYRRMPWKNGGGETAEIAIFPAQASIDDFDWRISMAMVASAGGFSSFSGVDRTLCILSDAPLHLAIGGADPVLVTRQSAPLAFAADTPVTATLAEGPVTDLNVMTRRGRWSHQVVRRRITGPLALAGRQGETLCVIADAGFSLPRTGTEVGPYDTLVLAGEAAADLVFAAPATVYVVTLVSSG